MKKIFLFLNFFLLSSCFVSAAEELPSVGVYYFPGWTDNASGLAYKKPWEPIKKFPQRQPLKGWYQDGEAAVVQAQMAEMLESGVDYVVFDWYWDRGRSYLEQPLRRYISLTEKKPDFAVMWANHGKANLDVESVEALADYWISNFFKNDKYLKIDNDPIVWIYSAAGMSAQAEASGRTLDDVLEQINRIVMSAGFGKVGFIFIGPGSSQILKLITNPLVIGVTAYNYHSGPDGFINGERRVSRSFAELDVGYAAQWKWSTERLAKKYLVAATVGWDRRPWGGSKDPLHDMSESTPAEFSKHMSNAANFIIKNRQKTFNSIMVCCWNEYGEGSVLEPTISNRGIFLDEVKKISPGYQKFTK